MTCSTGYNLLTIETQVNNLDKIKYSRREHKAQKNIFTPINPFFFVYRKQNDLIGRGGVTQDITCISIHNELRQRTHSATDPLKRGLTCLTHSWTTQFGCIKLNEPLHPQR